MVAKLSGKDKELMEVVKKNLDPLRVDKLLAAGANPNIVDEDGVAPVHYAAVPQRRNMMLFLLENGADANARIASNGTTPLHICAKHGHLEAAKLLLEFGADINAQDVLGRTPLHLASRNEEGVVVRFLLDKGADQNIEDAKGRKPFDHIKQPQEPQPPRFDRWDDLAVACASRAEHSAWGKGVMQYAFDLIERAKENKVQFDDLFDASKRKEKLLNGAESWRQFSEGGCSLAYDRDIAERLCSPSDLKRVTRSDGELSERNWLETQANALWQAANLIRSGLGDVKGGFTAQAVVEQARTKLDGDRALRHPLPKQVAGLIAWECHKDAGEMKRFFEMGGAYVCDTLGVGRDKWTTDPAISEIIKRVKLNFGQPLCQQMQEADIRKHTYDDVEHTKIIYCELPNDCGTPITFRTDGKPSAPERAGDYAFLTLSEELLSEQTPILRATAITVCDAIKERFEPENFSSSPSAAEKAVMGMVAEKIGVSAEDLSGDAVVAYMEKEGKDGVRAIFNAVMEDANLAWADLPREMRDEVTATLQEKVHDTFGMQGDMALRAEMSGPANGM